MKVLTEEKIIKIDQKIEEVENEGLVSLLGETVELFCVNYIYAGKLIGVNKTCVKLDNAHIVYETGELGSNKYKDAQKIGRSSFYVNVSAIEAFGPGKQL